MTDLLDPVRMLNKSFVMAGTRVFAMRKSKYACCLLPDVVERRRQIKDNESTDGFSDEDDVDDHVKREIRISPATY